MSLLGIKHEEDCHNTEEEKIAKKPKYPVVV
jgi:hypothetical protein